VAVWIVFYNHFSKSQQLDEEILSDLREAERQLELARTLFPTFMKSFDRRDGFQSLFPKVCAGLPSKKKAICHNLNVLRQSLIKHYFVVESTFPQFIDSAASEDVIYKNFRAAFAASREGYSEFILAFIPEIHTQLRAKLKRSRAESTNDTGIVTQKRM